MGVGSDAAPAGVLRKHALGRRRGSARLATRGCLPGAWLTAAVEAGPRLRQLGCPQGATLTGTRAGLDGPRKARPGAGRRTPRWRAGRRPRSREGTRHQRTMVAPPGAPSPSLLAGGHKEDGPPRGLDKEYGWRSVG